VHERECLFGEIKDDKVLLSHYGELVTEEWLRTAEIRNEVEIDYFIVMPNHVHGIVSIRDYADVGAHGRAPLQRLPRSLGSFIAGFKSIATKRINELRHTPGSPVWQRNYYERVIRNEDELMRMREYITDNPARWAEDVENPHRIA
jgi:REP element-mobilizing transposase RayT